MTIVCIKPMPEKYRTITPLYRPGIPPIFQDIGPEGVTEDDRKQARELFRLLDKESQQWYLIHCKWLSDNDFEKPMKSKKSKTGRKKQSE